MILAVAEGVKMKTRLEVKLNKMKNLNG